MARASIYLDDDPSFNGKAEETQDDIAEKFSNDNIANKNETSNMASNRRHNDENDLTLTQYEGRSLEKEPPTSNIELESSTHARQGPGTEGKQWFETVESKLSTFLPEHTYGDEIAHVKTPTKESISSTIEPLLAPEKNTEKPLNDGNDSIMDVISLLDEDEKKDNLEEIIKEVYMKVEKDITSTKKTDILNHRDIKESAIGSPKVTEVEIFQPVLLSEKLLPDTENGLSGDVTSTVFIDDFYDIDYNDLEQTNLREDAKINETIDTIYEMKDADETRTILGYEKQPRTLADEVKLRLNPDGTGQTARINQSIDVHINHTDSVVPTLRNGEQEIKDSISIEDQGMNLNIPHEGGRETSFTALKKSQEDPNAVLSKGHMVNVADKDPYLSENNSSFQGANQEKGDEANEISTLLWEDNLMDVMDVLYEEENEIDDFYKTELDGVRSYTEIDYKHQLKTRGPAGQPRKSFMKGNSFFKENVFSAKI